MASFQWFFWTILSLFFFKCLAEQENSRIHRGYFGKKQVTNLPTVYVDPSGHGNFTTIQSAIDSVPQDNKNWICIYIKAGAYREQVRIPREKPYIYLKGEGKRKTNVTWDGHDSIAADATLISEADYTVVKSITFINSYNIPPNGNVMMQAAVAAMISGDKSTFYRCGFLGLQDTLWDVQGRHYFKLCTIVGAVDFIFGNGQSIYERCSIAVNAGAVNGLIGFITAQGRTDPNDQSGFVFKDCGVFGTGLTFLGRPWRQYARVLFYNSSMSDVVVQQGWAAWNFIGREHQLTFSEENCKGIGSIATQRVSWAAKLSQQELQQLTSLSFIDNEGWIMNQPVKVL
ncbi:probable pectinesterase 29 [Lycium ferocissimum]|uniref:probable pectinesterase 29 n=1 Tax=Lycium ferocissimum TaxID=112874 RepID=UPI0028163075|nr:probable pectinesterase 29 [Lycium ferocissimum]